MRINIQVTVEPDRPDTAVVHEDFTIRASKDTPMAYILDNAKRTTPELVRKAVSEARAQDARQAAKVAGR